MKGQNWRFRLVLTIATAALLVGAAAFALGLAATTARSHQALTDAQRATRRANEAALTAIAAAHRADEAHRHADQATGRLCVFLGTIKKTRIDEAHVAKTLFISFGCAKR